MTQLTGGEAIVRMLQLHGLEYSFGMAGYQSLPYYDALARQRHADEATRLAQHEIDHRRSDLLRRADEIALVLAVLVIGNHDELARAQIGDCLLNRSNWHESPRQ